MARKLSSTAVQEELYPISSGDPEVRGNVRGDVREDVSERDRVQRQPFDGSRVVDLESEQESPFLRAQKRVAVRRASLPKKATVSLKWAGLGLALLAVIGMAAIGLYRYGKHSWRFRIDSSDQIEISGGQHVTHAQIMDVMGGDIGRNIFFVPLAQRQLQLQQIPWVDTASVMRLVPNRLRIEIHERTPVAFARVGSHVSLIDAGGNLMELAPGPKHKYSFPVIMGMSAGEPLSTRSARMKDYNELMRELDAGGAHYSQDLSEVDLSDSDDVRVMTADSGGGVLVHLGNGNYLQRYKIYVTHVEAWRQQFQKLESVDLRYEGQIIVNPDLQGLAHQPALPPAAAKAALAAGVKTTAIVNYEKYVTHPEPAAPSGKASAATKPGAPATAATKTGSQTASKKAGHHSAHSAAHSAAAKAKARVVSTKSVPAKRSPAKSVAAKGSSQPHELASTSGKGATSGPATTVTVAGKKPSAGIKEKPQD